MPKMVASADLPKNLLSAMHRMQAASSIALVFLLGVLVLTYRTTVRLVETNHLVTHADAAITELDGILAGLDSIENSRLAWVTAGAAMHNLRARRSREPACGLCHDPHTRPIEAERYRRTHVQMILDLSRHVQGLRSMAAFEPPQRQRLAGIE